MYSTEIANQLPYGAWELKVTYQRNMFLSMALVTGLTAMLVLIGWGLGLFEKPALIVIENARDGGGTIIIDPPPVIKLDDLPVAGGGGMRPAAEDLPIMVIPEAVPDSMIDDANDMLIPDRDQLSRIVDNNSLIGEPGEGTDTGSGVTGFGGIDDAYGEIPDPKDFIIYEVDPKMISEVPPEYPRFAERAGLEGAVWVQVLIDTEGNVIRAEVLKSSQIQSLDEAAIEAARKNKFSPGIQNDHPVPCWVKYKVEFKLSR